MIEIIGKFVKEKNNGLMLLDLPTGFGKTTSVVKYIIKLLNEQSSIKKIFFVTNLKNNLPIKLLKDILGNDFDKYCLFLKPNWQAVVENWKNTNIIDNEVINSEEYKNLNLDIETLDSFKKEKEKLKNENEFNDKYKRINKIIKSYENKIEKDSEIKFRQFLKNRYFYKKNSNEKQKNLKNNTWLEEIYPVCKIKNETIKVILTSTKKFFSPIDTFVRMPFYIYNDELVENSITFIDEFDTTKDTLLNQIVEDGLKFDIDVFSLFLNIYYSLSNLKFPTSLTKLSSFRKEKIEANEWQNIETLLEDLHMKFKEVYEDNRLNLFIKSKDFNDKKVFLFDDGKMINIFSDTSKKFFGTKVDEKENNISLCALPYSKKNVENKRLDEMLRDLKYAINNFVNKVAYISKNYTDYKNEKNSIKTKYTFEESVLTILSAFNISDEFKQYLVDKIIDKNANLKLSSSLNNIKCDFMRKGFEFTEIEDDNIHDLQTKTHSFKFNTTPEDILIKLCMKSRVVGISATASIKTVIGNYDINYLMNSLQDDFYIITSEDYIKLKSNFQKSQEIYDKENIRIKINIVDNSKYFVCKDQCLNILEEVYKEEYLKIYKDFLEKNDKLYYFLIQCKIIKLYKEVASNSKIYSFLAFLNSFPRKENNFSYSKSFIDEELLNKMLNDIKEQEQYKNAPILHIVKSINYEEEFILINKELKEGKKVFILSTYKTIGNGKNIQYSIPEIQNIKENIILKSNDNLKDFDAIYLSTPTNLIQALSSNSEDKIKNLCKYLFQQEYLYQNKHITYFQCKNNIELGFRKTFYGEYKPISYRRNQDVLLNTAQLVIQAVGRICRCQNKNKEIYIFSDSEVINRLNLVKNELNNDFIFNREFIVLKDTLLDVEDFSLEQFTQINKSAYKEIVNRSKELRQSQKNIEEWKKIRDFVLKYPTASKEELPIEYINYYFYFNSPQSGYNFLMDKNYNFIKISFEQNYMNQVSEEESELMRLMCIEEIKELFEKNFYATSFKLNNYIMSQSLYKQIYKAALGEVVGKFIVEEAIVEGGLQEIKDVSCYEFFDYQIGDIYFDFKHWDNFIKENDEYSKKVENKLKQINGRKAIIINLFQRGEHNIKTSIDSKIIQIPYLINDDNEIEYNQLNFLQELIEETKMHTK